MTRIRQEGNLDGAFTSQITFVQNNGCTGVTSTTYQSAVNTYKGKGRMKVMSDELSPKFNERKRQGWTFFNPMSLTEDEVSGSTAPWSAYTEWACNGQGGITRQTETVSGEAGWRMWGKGSPLPHNVDLDNLISLATSAAWANIEPPDMQGLVSLAELRKTLAMIRKPLGAIRKDFLRFFNNLAKWQSYSTRKAKNTLRGRKTKPFKIKGQVVQSAADVINGTWLELRYGWRPLIYEIDGLTKALSNPKIQLGRRTARGKSEVTVNVNQTRTAVPDAISGACRADVSDSTVGKITVRAGLLYEQRLQTDNWGTHIREVPSTAWELVPFSFVVDWFVNTSDFIQGMSYAAGATVFGSWKTVEVDLTNTRIISNGSRSGFTVTSNGGGTYLVRNRTKKRTIGLSLPHLAIKKDSLRNVCGDARALDLIALVAQQLKILRSVK